eukprot:10627686-Alexandrium_andersonii.AAC.1
MPCGARRLPVRAAAAPLFARGAPQQSRLQHALPPGSDPAAPLPQSCRCAGGGACGCCSRNASLGRTCGCPPFRR